MRSDNLTTHWRAAHYIKPAPSHLDTINVSMSSRGQVADNLSIPSRLQLDAREKHLLAREEADARGLAVWTLEPMLSHAELEAASFTFRRRFDLLDLKARACQWRFLHRSVVTELECGRLDLTKLTDTDAHGAHARPGMRAQLTAH